MRPSRCWQAPGWAALHLLPGSLVSSVAARIPSEEARGRNAIRLLRLEIKPDLPLFTGTWSLYPVCDRNCKLQTASCTITM